MVRPGSDLHGVGREGPPFPRKFGHLARPDIVACYGQRPGGSPRVAAEVDSLRAAPAEAVLRAIQVQVVRGDGVVADAEALLVFVALDEPAVRIQRHQGPTAFRHRRGEENPFAVCGRVVKNAVVGPPGADRILAAVGEVHSIARFQAGMRDASPTVRSRCDELARFAEAIPDHGVKPRRESTAGNEVTDTDAGIVFDDDRGLAFDGLLKRDTDLLLALGNLFPVVLDIERSPIGRVLRERHVDGTVVTETQTLPLIRALDSDRKAETVGLERGNEEVRAAGQHQGVGFVGDAQRRFLSGGADGDLQAVFAFCQGDGDGNSTGTPDIQVVG